MARGMITGKAFERMTRFYLPQRALEFSRVLLVSFR